MSLTKSPKTCMDSWVNESSPGENYADAEGLKLSGDTGARKRGYVWFPTPFKEGDVVLEATLELTPLSGFSGSDSFTATRVTEEWQSRKITWDNQPDVHATDQTSASSSGDPLIFDVTAMLNNVSGGGAWFGVRVTTGASGIRRFHSANSPTYSARPQLTVTWARKPDPPTDLKPSGELVVSVSRPTVIWAFVDRKGNELQQKFQVLSDTTEDVDSNGVLETPDFDSGVITSTDEMLDLSTTAFPAMTSGDTRWWQVRAQNESGIWSDYSDLEQWYYVPLGTLTIDNPVNEGIVEETTPPIQWTYSGEGTAVNVWLFEGDPEEGYGTGYGGPYGGSSYVLEWEYGRRQFGVDQDTVHIPPGHIKRDDENRYKVRVRVWDGYIRQGLPGAPTYAEAEAVFSFAESATPSAPTGLAATEDDDRLVLSWSRSSMPDYWSIRADDELIADRIDGDEPFVSGTSYQFRVKKAKPARSAVYSVSAVVKDGGVYKHSLHTAAQVTHTFRPVGIYLRQEGTNELLRLEDWTEIPVTPVSEGQILQPVSSGSDPRPPPVRIVDSQGGYSASVTGTIVGHAYKATFQRFLGNPPDTKYIYTVDDLQQTVEAGDFTGPTHIEGWIEGQNAWTVGFTVIEVGDFDFRIRG